MTGKQHMAIGFSVACHSYDALFTLGAVIGALLPDIDLEHSIISNIIPLQKITKGRLMKHRGFTHSFIMNGIVWFIAVKFFGVVFGTGIGIGYLTHILSDCFTPRGVKLLAPFYNKSIKFLWFLNWKATTVGNIAMVFCVISLFFWITGF